MDASDYGAARSLINLAAIFARRGRDDPFFGQLARALGAAPEWLYGFFQGVLDVDVPTWREAVFEGGDELALLGYAEGRTFAQVVAEYQARG